MPSWSLILFTLIVQACVGALVWMEFLQLSPATRNQAVLPDSDRRKLMLGITAATGIAVLISIFHLGSPTKALFALSNLGSSWLSREVLLVILFGGGVALATLMQRRGWGSDATRTPISRLSALFGLTLVYVMARVYMLPTTPSWNTAATAISFYTTTLVLGGSVVVGGVIHSGKESAFPATTRVVVWAIIVCLGIEIVLVPFQAGVLYGHPLVVDNGDSFGVLTTLFGVRVLIVAVALGCLIKLRSAWIQRPGPLLLFTLALVLSAETLGRYIFYAFYYRVGV